MKVNKKILCKIIVFEVADGSFFVFYYMKQTIIFLFCISLSVTAFSQVGLPQFNIERLKITRTGMEVLGSWGAANLISGGIGLATANGEAKYFHQMNLIWGVTNFVIAGTTFLSLRKRPTDISLSESVKQQVGIEKTFLINGGLDLVYISAGVYCLEKANNSSNRDKYKGYGNSLLLQGGGLLLFDAFMYFINTNHGKQLYKLLDKVQFSGNSVGFVWRL